MEAIPMDGTQILVGTSPEKPATNLGKTVLSCLLEYCDVIVTTTTGQARASGGRRSNNLA